MKHIGSHSTTLHSNVIPERSEEIHLKHVRIHHQKHKSAVPKHRIKRHSVIKLHHKRLRLLGAPLPKH